MPWAVCHAPHPGRPDQPRARDLPLPARGDQPRRHGDRCRQHVRGRQATRPVVLTGPAKSIKKTRATLTGELNDFGVTTKYEFQWGTTKKYGETTPLASAGARKATLSVHAKLSGLKPGHVYHYRLVAISLRGRTTGSDATFTTKS